MVGTLGKGAFVRRGAQSLALRRSLRGVVKRAADLALALVCLVLLSPLLGAVALAIRLRMGSPVFFRQYRTGVRGRPFVMVKFRTMRALSAASAVDSRDRERVTRLGRILRGTKLDELPELWNILLGEMSFVGPRPLMPETAKYYVAPYAREAWRRRHEVRPGLTGWGQVNGNTALSFSRRYALDVWYADHASLWSDVDIVLRTFLVCIGGEGANAGAVEVAERYVFGARALEQVHREPASGSLPAPVGRPVSHRYAQQRCPVRAPVPGPVALVVAAARLTFSPAIASAPSAVEASGSVGAPHVLRGWFRLTDRLRIALLRTRSGGRYLGAA